MNALVEHQTSVSVHQDGLGGQIEILERGDATKPMRFRMVMPAGFGPPAPEKHPRIREDFRVLRGTLDLGRVNGTHVVLHAGDEFTLPPNTFHKPSNPSPSEPLEFEATLTPGHDAASMFESIYAATRDHSGPGRAVRQMIAFRRHADIISFPAPVRVVMMVLAAFGRMVGMRA